MADAFHQQGNSFYKKGDLESAKNSYISAFKINPSEPKYASNLSAVQYERGQYRECIEAIVESWRALRVKGSVDDNPVMPPTTDPLAIKLSLRFLKAKLNLLAQGLLSLHDDKGERDEDAAVIEQDMEDFCSELLRKKATSQHAELEHIWGVWFKTKRECQKHEAGECKKKLEEAEKRLRSLPIYKASLYDVIDYFRFGHDVPRPLFDEIGQNENLRIDERTLILEGWEKISFLFGGSGDGRHIFATLINWGSMWKRLSSRHILAFRFPDLHLTLLDIHPATLSRVMLIFALIRKSMTPLSATAKIELETTAFYLWSTILMPDYCAKVVMDVSQEIIDELKGNSPEHLTKFWAIDDQTCPRVLTVFEYWSKPLPQSTKTFLEINGPKDLRQNPTRAMLLEQRCYMRNQAYGAFVAAATRVKGSPFDIRKDPELQHPALEKHVRSGGRLGKNALTKEALQDWRPNCTLFDNATTENLAFSAPGGYPELTFDEDPSMTMMGVLQVVRHYRDVHTQLSFDQTSFAIMQQVFDSVRECFTYMDSRHDALTLEFVCTELCAGLPKVIAGDFGPRPASFPTKYKRMWLSNVPDYTGGMLSNLVYLAPYLEDTPLAYMLWNCLRNTRAFGSFRDFCFNYTYLTSSGIRQYFNCLVPNEHNQCRKNPDLHICSCDADLLICRDQC
ncbi:hypothetical protein BJ165DRAFT_1613427 [Panaeolus papilionaceus]|nr:hypothetical protein BJ165DRAFT_1613427 [Panaeolus papilionaceus]